MLFKYSSGKITDVFFENKGLNTVWSGVLLYVEVFFVLELECWSVLVPVYHTFVRIPSELCINKRTNFESQAHSYAWLHGSNRWSWNIMSKVGRGRTMACAWIQSWMLRLRSQKAPIQFQQRQWHLHAAHVRRYNLKCYHQCRVRKVTVRAHHHW